MSQAGARRDHLANDLQTLVAFLAPFVGGFCECLDGFTRPNEVIIWYDLQIVTAVLDDPELRDFVTCINVGAHFTSAEQLRQELLGLLALNNVGDGLVPLYHGRVSRCRRDEPLPGSPSNAAA